MNIYKIAYGAKTSIEGFEMKINDLVEEIKLNERILSSLRKNYLKLNQTEKELAKEVADLTKQIIEMNKKVLHNI